MTVLVDFAIREFIASYGTPGPIREEPDLRNIDQETWEEICEYRSFLDRLDYQRCLNELKKIRSNEESHTIPEFSVHDGR